MFASLRAIHDEQKGPDKTPRTATSATGASAAVRRGGEDVPTMRQLRGALFAAMATSESHFTRLQEGCVKQQAAGGHCSEGRVTNDMPHALRAHLRAVTCEAIRSWQHRKQQQEEEGGGGGAESREVDRKGGVWAMDHGVMMSSEEDIAQLLWMNRTVALGGTTSTLNGISHNGKKFHTVSSSSRQQEEQWKSYGGVVPVQETIRFLRQSSPALRAVLISRSAPITGASRREEREDTLLNTTTVIAPNSPPSSPPELISSECPPPSQGELRSKRSRVREEEEEVNTSTKEERVNKRPFALAVKIDGRVLRPQQNPQSEVGGTAGTLYQHHDIQSGVHQEVYEETKPQQRQQQKERPLSGIPYGGGVSSHTSLHPRSQMTLNVDSRGRLCLTHPPASPLSHLNTILRSSLNLPLVGNTTTATPSTTNNSSFAIKRVPQHWMGEWSGVNSSERTTVEEERDDRRIKENRSWNPPVPDTREGGKEDVESKSYAAVEAVGHQGAGFITAGEQLVVDVKSGRSMPSALSLRGRTPALGLRRSGFTPPFQQRQQLSPPPPPTRSDDPSGTNTAGMANTVSVNEVLSSIRRNPRSAHDPVRGVRGNNNNNMKGGGGGCDDSDSERGDYPASLLLPDGSVPPILLPLDPKLVAQVAMEILEHGAGASSVGWDDIAGLEHAKRSVEEAIVWPLRRPDLFVGLRDPPRGLLLFGPPGTGKTMIARAIANRAQCTFLNISASSLMSKWMGDGEKLVRCMFAVATVKQPSVIFIDEIDSLLSTRGEGEMDSVRRVKTEFLVQLDGVATDRGDRVLLIGATNRPDELDEAARRRMEKRLYIPLPDTSARVELVKRLLHTMEEQNQPTQLPSVEDSAQVKRVANVAHALSEKEILEIAAVTEGYSGADLKQVCREAAMGPLREVTMRLRDVMLSELRPIQRKDFTQALRCIRPSVGVSEVTRYVAWNEQFGSFTSQGGEATEEEEEENKVLNTY